MEWVLQLVDECDDIIGAVRHWWLAVAYECELILVGLLGIAICAVALLIGFASTGLATAALAVGAGSALAFRSRILRATAR